jgi:DNA-directed RNA polymerase subunit F
VKILDIMPKTKEELGLIFEKVRFDLTDAKAKKILSVVSSLRK